MDVIAEIDKLSEDQVTRVFAAGLAMLNGEPDDAKRWRYFNTPGRWFNRDPETGLFSVGLNVTAEGLPGYAITEAMDQPTLKAAIDVALSLKAVP